MANDRLYIVCQCGAWHMLYKFYPANGYMGHNLDDWMNEHTLHNKDDTPSTFSLMWENRAAELTHNHVKRENCDLCIEAFKG
jgi:hypothetical protein